MSIVCYFDACCEPKNPGGHIGLGGIIIDDSSGEILIEISDYIKESKGNSNNVGEYLAFIKIIDWLLDNNHINSTIKIYGDSKLVINQMTGDWNINNGLYVTYANDGLNKIKRFKNLTIGWIPREENELADDLSKRMLINNNVEFKIQPLDSDIRFPFGKYKDSSISKCNNSNYIQWFLDNCKPKNKIKDALNHRLILLKSYKNIN